MPVSVRIATRADEAVVVDIIVLAFSADPVARWCWPDPHRYLAAMPTFVRAFAGQAFDGGSAFQTADAAGGALWLRPGMHPDEASMGELLEGTMAAPARAELLAAIERTAAYHPKGPHWFLPLAGVDPARQGQGHGTALMAHALAECDREHLPAYLESTNPRNVTLYERHGFRALGRVPLGGSAAFVPMLRPPR
jgi:GNAT superfamily N-acetyltransferase